MVAHDFIVKDKKNMLKYKLIFYKTYCGIITLPAPSLFNIHSGTYLIMPADIHAYSERTRSPDPEPKPSSDPYQESIYQWDTEKLTNQWNPEDPPQYTEEDHFDPWA